MNKAQNANIVYVLWLVMCRVLPFAVRFMFNLGGQESSPLPATVHTRETLPLIVKEQP